VPEGHVIHGIAQLHRRVLVGGPVHVESPRESFPDASLFDGAVLTDVEAFGKHLWYHFDAGSTELLLHVHLGLIGWVRTRDADPLETPWPSARMHLRSDRGTADFVGVTQCALVDAEQRTKVISALGPDPLRADADQDVVWRRLHASRRPISALLLDQSVLAGIGNVYRAELLFRGGLPPGRPGRLITRSAFDRLWSDAVRQLRIGLRMGRIVTTDPIDRDHRSGRVRDEDARYVYGRAGLPCRRCGTPISARVEQGRTLYWCPTCQRGR